MWDSEQAVGMVRASVAEHLGGQELVGGAPAWLGRRGLGCGGRHDGAVTDVPAPVAVQIRTSRVALLAVLLGISCVTPLAAASRWLLWLYLVPVLAGVWVLRAGVDVDTEGVTVRALARSRRVGWARVAGLMVGQRGKVRLVLTSGGWLRLPAVRVRHLPLLAAASGGRLPDVSAAPPPVAPQQQEGSQQESQ